MATLSIKQLLHSVPIFKELTDEELQPIIDISQTRVFDAKSHVFMQGDVLDRVFFIYSGKVKIYKTDFNGREQIVSILTAGDMFPHAGFFRKGEYPAHAEIIEPSTLVVISIANFEQILIKYPDVSMKVFRVMGEKIIDLQNRLEEQILSNTYEQIIKLLLRLAKNHGKIYKGDTNKIVITTQFTNRELANMIGSSRETVSRTLNQLKKRGLIDTNSEGLYIIETEKLEDELY
ncbi:Crp/Fnr family transcriptional regulator [Calidifontibacillus oryziterrae]|uniref:Crp/Fnr family transcriptional regulator n=1 Tax=Calidifontibacillus oryziterrae TaxID=1191699 RepID=UPI0002FBC8C6|nr:Crp/Fnr family transcriptional regulator [Calidifontibacillus oryziterrae]